MDATMPKYQWGQRVLAVDNLYNDGSYPERAPDALLVAQGALGEVMQVGKHEESDTLVYMVEFPGNGVVGCLEQEITPA